MRRAVLLIPVFILLGGCAASTPATPAIEEPPLGLVRVPSRHVDTVYAVQGMSLAPFRRVMLDSVQVEFKPDWQKRHPEITDSDLTIIHSRIGAAFREVFGVALSTNHGYGLTTQSGPDVLRVSTTISGLEVANSSVGTTGARNFAVSPTDLVLLMELRDSQGGALLVRAIDHTASRSPGDLQVADSMSSNAKARRELETWANLLRKVLDEARAAPAPNS